jgi:hypothetical protein
MPMGAVGLCNLLAGLGHGVWGANLAVESTFDPDLELDAWLRARPAPDLALVDLHWHEHSLGAVELAEAIGRVWPGCRLVLGGMTASLLAEEILAVVPAVDAVIRGDAEEPLRRLVASMAAGEAQPPRGVPNLVRRGAREPRRWVASGGELDGLDFASLGFLEHAEAYRRLLHSHPRRPGREARVGLQAHWLSNGRGCAFDCAACGGGRSAHRRLTGRRGITWRSPDALGRDLARLRGAGVQQACLGLDPELAGWDHCAASVAGARGMGLYLESFQLPSAALFDLLVDCCDPEHCEIVITPLSGDEALRRRHGKGFDDGALVEAVAGLRARELSATVFFSIGLPGEDEGAFEATLRLARRLVDADQRGLLRVAALPQALDPLAPMGREPGGWGMELVGGGGLAARLERGRALRTGRWGPWSPEVLGYAAPGCEVEERMGRWGELVGV